MGYARVHGRFLRAFAVTGVGTALFALWIGLGLGGATVVAYVDDLGTAIAAVVASLLCARAARAHHDRERRFWTLLAAALGAWALGEILWGFYELVLRAEVPVPSWADVGYLSAIPLAIAALLSHPAMHDSRRRNARSFFDALLVAGALLFLSWTFALGPLWKSTDLTTAGGLVAFAYPFGDVLIVFFVLLVERRMRREDRLALQCLLIGLLAMAVTDSSYAYLTTVQKYEPGNLLDIGWVAGYLAIAVGAWCASPAGEVAPRPRAVAAPSLAPIVAPFLALLAALTALAVEVQLGHRPDTVGLVVAFGLMVSVLARQALVLADLVADHQDPDAGVLERLHAALLRALPEETAARGETPP